MNRDSLKSSIVFGIFSNTAKIPFLLIIFYLVNYDRSLNPDYHEYFLSYINNWNRFGIGFEWLQSFFSGFTSNFDVIWILFLTLILFLIALLYNKLWLFLLSFPNLVYQSQGFIGTQLRFAIASLLIIYIYKTFKDSKLYFLTLLIPICFHSGVVVFYVIIFFVDYFFSFDRFISKKNTISLLVFSAGCLSTLLIYYIILNYLGYGYYDMDSGFLRTKSTISIVYTILSILFLMYFFWYSDKYKLSFSKIEKCILYSAFLILIFCLIYSTKSVISGRYLKLYFIVEPIILYILFKKTLRHKKIILFNITIIAFYLSKALSITYIL